MATTSLVAELTKTYFAPPLMHLIAQALWSALAPLAPQPESLIHPVHDSALAETPTASSSTTAIAKVLTSFFIVILPPSLGSCILVFSPGFVNAGAQQAAPLLLTSST